MDRRRPIFCAATALAAMILGGCACLVDDDPLYKEGATPGDLGTFPRGCSEVFVVYRKNAFDDAAFMRIYPNLRDRHVTALNLSDTAITGATLISVKKLEDLVWLDLADTKVSPQEIKLLKGMPRLKAVVVGGPLFNHVTIEKLSGELQPISVRHW